MDELTFLLILSGIGVILLIAMFTYYKHHKKIHDEIQDFNHHSHDIDDVLLDEYSVDKKDPTFSRHSLKDTDMPDSFSASKQDNFDIDEIRLSNDSDSKNKSVDRRELVDGVYVNSKRVISTGSATVQKTATTAHNSIDTFKAFANSKAQVSETAPVNKTDNMENSAVIEQAIPDSDDSIPTFAQADKQVKSESETFQQSQQRTQTIKIVYDAVPEGVEELIISHTILAKGDYFSGQKLFNVIQSAGLSFGEMNIFHYPGDDQAETFALFSIANVVEPGTFNLNEAESFTTPGISMFMRLPARSGGNNEAYEIFIATARKIASELGGELCDETRSQLTQQTISYKKEQIRKLNFNLAKAEKLAGTN